MENVEYRPTQPNPFTSYTIEIMREQRKKDVSKKKKKFLKRNRKTRYIRYKAALKFI